MSMNYTHQVLKIAVAQICQSIGFQSIQPTAMELMVDILHRYMQEITRLSHHYAELYNRIEPNLDDVALAFKDNNVNLSDLEEYIQFVDPVKCVVDVPKYPLPKESHLNFLKPGSREVLTRPLYIHEHLPPIDPVVEDDEAQIAAFESSKKTELDDFESMAIDENFLGNDVAIEVPFENGKKEIDVNLNPFKRPGEPPSSYENSNKRPRFVFDENRPARDLNTTSGFVMTTLMTTSGFISPAREGKLPDSKCPVTPDIKPIQPIPTQPSALPISSMDGKFDKKLKKKIHDKEKKKDKDKTSKNLFRPDKSVTMKKTDSVANIDEQNEKITEIKSAIFLEINSTLSEQTPAQFKSNVDLPKNIDEKLQSLIVENVLNKTPSELKAIKKQQKLMQQVKHKTAKQNRFQKNSDGSILIGKKPKKNKMLFPLPGKKQNYLKTQLTALHDQTGPFAVNCKNSMESLSLPTSFSTKTFTDFIPPSDYYEVLQKTDGTERDIKKEVQNLKFLSNTGQTQFSHLLTETLLEPKLHQTSSVGNSIPSTASQATAMLDGKISAAPDRAKLNIFKKIPSKNKEDMKINEQHLSSLASVSQKSANRPTYCSNVIVIDDDSSPSHTYTSEKSFQQAHSKQEFKSGAQIQSNDDFPTPDLKSKVSSETAIQNYCAEQDHPLNLTGGGHKSLPLLPAGTHASSLHFGTIRQSCGIDDFTSHSKIVHSGTKLQNMQISPNSAAAIKKAQKKQKNKSSRNAAATAAAQQQQQLMQDYSKNFLPSLSLGALGMPSFPYQFLPSRPGLIPESPLIPQFDPMRPFAWPMPGFGFPSLPHPHPVSNLNPIVNSPRSDAALPPSRGRGRPPLHQHHHLNPSHSNEYKSTILSTSIRPTGPNSDLRNINKYMMDSKCNVASMIPESTKLVDVPLIPITANALFSPQQQLKLPPFYSMASTSKKVSTKITKTPKSKNDGCDRVPGKRGPKPKNKESKLSFFSSLPPFTDQPQLSPLLQPHLMSVDDFNKPQIDNKSHLLRKFPATHSIVESGPLYKSISPSSTSECVSETPQYNENQITTLPISSNANAIANKQILNPQLGDLVNNDSLKMGKKLQNLDLEEYNSEHRHINLDYTTLAEKNLLASLNPPIPQLVADDNSLDISTALIIEERSKKERRSKDKEHKKERKEKDGKFKKKKEKKEKSKNRNDKKKEKETAKVLEIDGDDSFGKETKLSKKEKKEKRKEKERLLATNESTSIFMNSEDTSDDGSQASSVPKLTLKLGQSSSSPRSDTSEKKNSDTTREKLTPTSNLSVEPIHDINRETTPEHEFQLARISALITRPTGKPDDILSTPTKQRPKMDQSSPNRNVGHTESTLGDFTILPSVFGAVKKHDRVGRPCKDGRSGGKKLKHSSTPGCSAEPTNAKDSEGNEIWICPACGRVDDGSPMIGCDACDAWYHWLCVGIRVPPEGSWYCRVCIGRKQETFLMGEKKKKRKKKDKKEHQ